MKVLTPRASTCWQLIILEYPKSVHWTIPAFSSPRRWNSKTRASRAKRRKKQSVLRWTCQRKHWFRVSMLEFLLNPRKRQVITWKQPRCTPTPTVTKPKAVLMYRCAQQPPPPRVILDRNNWKRRKERNQRYRLAGRIRSNWTPWTSQRCYYR